MARGTSSSPSESPSTLCFPETPLHRSTSLSQPPRPRRIASQRAEAINAQLYEDDGMLDSQATDSQAVRHILNESPLPSCEHVLLATADIMGIDLACDRFTPPPGLHSLESDEDFEESQVIESQLIDPVESLYPTWWAQRLYDRGHVSLDWAFENARQPNAIVANVTDVGPSAQPSSPNATPVCEGVGEPVVRHPTPEKATPRQPPSTEPTRRQALVLSAQEKETIQLLRQHEQQKLRGTMKMLTSVVPSPKHGTLPGSMNKGKGKGKGNAD